MAPLVGMLISYGPTLIRSIGGLFGGKTSDAANTVANLVDEVKGLPDAVAEERLAEKMAKLPPETQIEFEKVKVRLAEIEKDREANRLAAETAQHNATQETARIEAQSSDEYVRRTRPGLARKSAFVTFAYALITGVLFPALNAINGTELPGPDAWIISALFSPCLGYMGARSVDAFSSKGKTG
jgi:hypothetical protein